MSAQRELAVTEPGKFYVRRAKLVKIVYNFNKYTSPVKSGHFAFYLLKVSLFGASEPGLW